MAAEADVDSDADSPMAELRLVEVNESSPDAALIEACTGLS